MNYTLDYNYDTQVTFDHEEQKNRIDLLQWCELKDLNGVTVGHIQPACSDSVEFTDLNVKLTDEDQEHILRTADKLMKMREKEWKKERAIEEIKDSTDFEEIEEKANKIATILNKEYDENKYLILANTLYTAKSISILDTMVFLQIALECEQSQSSEIINLFIKK